MTQLTYQNVSKAFGDVEALVGLNLDIASGEFFALVGSSGCGKSTALRIAAGLETPDHGDVKIDGSVITHLAPRQRAFGLVTQQNALVSNHTAAGNISLPLKARQLHRDDISDRVRAEAEQFGIEYLLDRRRDELSGGEAQAVQFARALVARPRVLLLDEPLAKIDASIRHRLRGELVRIQREYRVTTLLITSDQEDAMVLADRVAVLDHGRLQQVGPPMDLYRQPVNLEVAGFFGEPAMNRFLVEVVDIDDRHHLVIGGHGVPVDHIPTQRFVRPTTMIGIRPEDVRLVSPGAAEPALSGIVDRIESRGPSSVVEVRTEQPVGAEGEPGRRLVATVRGPGPRLGETVHAAIDPLRLHLFDDVTGAALHHPA